jgi:hypothetical protein
MERSWSAASQFEADLKERRSHGCTATVEQFHAVGPSLAGMVALNSLQNEQLMPAAIAMILLPCAKMLVGPRMADELAY